MINRITQKRPRLYVTGEKIQNNLSKVVVIVWLFLVFVLTQSYTASLTSMLTVSRLEPNVTNIEWIKRTNVPVGCDGDSVVYNYLRNVLELQNIKNITNQDDYPGEFESGNITAAFLEVPYQKVFLKHLCNEYTVTGPTYRFGGLGFVSISPFILISFFLCRLLKIYSDWSVFHSYMQVFQKGSPIARDFSKAILTLSENGKLKGLEDHWLGSSTDCSQTKDSLETESLSFSSFWSLYLISGITSTLCLLIFLISLWRKTWWKRLEQLYQKNEAQNKGGIINNTVLQLAQPRRSTTSVILGRSSTLTRRCGSSKWDLLSPSDPASEHFDSSSSKQVGIQVKD